MKSHQLVTMVRQNTLYLMKLPFLYLWYFFVFPNIYDTFKCDTNLYFLTVMLHIVILFSDCMDIICEQQTNKLGLS